MYHRFHIGGLLRKIVSKKVVGSPWIHPYVKTRLVKYKDHEAPFTHSNKINDQPNDRLGLQNRVFHKQSGNEVH